MDTAAYCTIVPTDTFQTRTSELSVFESTSVTGNLAPEMMSVAVGGPFVDVGTRITKLTLATGSGYSGACVFFAGIQAVKLLEMSANQRPGTL